MSEYQGWVALVLGFTGVLLFCEGAAALTKTTVYRWLRGLGFERRTGEDRRRHLP